MLQFIESLLQPETLPWVLFGASFIALTLLFLTFFIHRRNNKNHISRLEERMHEHDTQIFIKIAEDLDHFKKALMVHLSEISDRIKDNETLTNKIVNMVDNMRVFLEENNEANKETE